MVTIATQYISNNRGDWTLVTFQNYKVGIGKQHAISSSNLAVIILDILLNLDTQVYIYTNTVYPKCWMYYVCYIIQWSVSPPLAAETPRGLDRGQWGGNQWWRTPHSLEDHPTAISGPFGRGVVLKQPDLWIGDHETEKTMGKWTTYPSVKVLGWPFQVVHLWQNCCSLLSKHVLFQRDSRYLCVAPTKEDTVLDQFWNVQ